MLMPVHKCYCAITDKYYINLHHSDNTAISTWYDTWQVKLNVRNLNQ